MPYFRSLAQFEAMLDQHSFERGQGYILDRIQQAIIRLDHPELRYKVIHVTGTSGKGSTCRLIASILQSAGYRTGLFMSPHLVRINERLMINQRPITDAAFLQLLNRLWPLVADLQLSYFEWLTLLALTYFAKRRVDYAVIEVGMGGRSDATNVVTPTLAMVTEVGLDHMKQLGNTRQKIAREKEAIIKPGCIGLTGSRYVHRGRYVDLGRAEIVHESLNGTVFHYRSYRNVQLALPGRYQVRNAILALEACQALKISESAIRRGLRTAKHPGRFTVWQRRPLIIIDGAHNPHKMQAFMKSLRALTKRSDFTQVIALIAVKHSKDLPGTLKPLLPFINHAIITTFGEGAAPLVLKRVIQKIRPGLSVAVEPNLGRAYARLRQQLTQRDLGIITGSLYMIGDLYSLTQSRHQ